MECKCSLRTRLIGDGCAVCNPDLARELAEEELMEKRAEDYESVEREQLRLEME